ncbi:MAG: accessory factor UbiK family protein [Burkholderiales bacterium]|jgi:BMFP domain-containing protein YqiC|nr:accessory factor UbiK family protein [Burkholderiales bacterium]MCA3161023.1 accessory factor UbiK family protein [Burkholderiales bacterium]MCA3162893.1 accessory factor UbiK family protein [Burkholderiales bacterium]MCA3166158.1 accessory factor UbiK family protein [Burkholderiales bacterium]MCA3169197.1 accessory factor UbiK family protein [Burkholderiales bacterium]
MNKAEFLQDLQQKISDLMRQSPAAEIEKNLKALLNQGFARLELVTREEFDVQREVLARTRAKLTELEKRLNDLEQNLPQ